MLRKSAPKVGGARFNNWAVVDDKNGAIEQFNTPVGRITYNIVQTKSKREKKSTTGMIYKGMPNVSYHFAIQPKHQKILHNNGLADNIVCL